MSQINAPISPKLAQLRSQGINDRGEFKGNILMTANGFASSDLRFEAPALKKGVATEVEYRTEKALNYRDSMVAELAREKPDVKKLEQFAKKLVKQGVDLSRLNWSMGTDKLNRPTPRQDKNTMENLQLGLAKAAYANLSRLLDNKAVGTSSNAVLEVFARLQTGLAKTIFPAESTKGSEKLAELKDQESKLVKAMLAHDQGLPAFGSQDEADFAPLILDGIRAEMRQIEASKKRIATPTTTNTTATTTTNTTATTTTTTTSETTTGVKTPVSTGEPKPRIQLETLDAKIQETEEKLRAATKMLYGYETGETQGTLEQKDAAYAILTMTQAQLEHLKKLKAVEEEAIRSGSATPKSHLLLLIHEKAGLERLMVAARQDRSEFSHLDHMAAQRRLAAIDKELPPIPIAAMSSTTTTTTTLPQGGSDARKNRIELLDIAIQLLEKSPDMGLPGAVQSSIANYKTRKADLERAAGTTTTTNVAPSEQNLASTGQPQPRSTPRGN